MLEKKEVWAAESEQKHSNYGETFDSKASNNK